MCEFFSFVTNGTGLIKYFSEEDIIKIEKQGNPEQYDYNSHASICKFYDLNEDKMNKYEFDPETNKFKIDQINNIDDSKIAKKWVIDFWKDSKLLYIKLCKGNSGYWNSGNMNSGNRNSGKRNSGNMNSGYQNSGNMNSGNRNSGNRNSGDRNSGYWNSGNRNSGDRNSGNWNSGDRNSGYFNTDRPNIRLFNKETKLKTVSFPTWFYFDLNTWIYADSMTSKEKKANKNWEILGGYLKKMDYKEAWKKAFKNECDKEQAKQTINLPNFDYKIFEEITGITKRMLDESAVQ